MRAPLQVRVARRARQVAVDRQVQRISAVHLGHLPFGTVPSRYSLKRLAYFPRLGIAFSRVRKNANTFVMRTLAALDLQQEVDERAIGDIKVHYTVRLGDFRTLRQIRDAPIITVARDPYSRTLSAFLDKFRAEKNYFRERFGDFRPDPEGFAAFLRFLDAGNLYADLHWAPQVHSMLPLHYYDRILRQESLDAEFHDALNSFSILDGQVRFAREPVGAQPRNRFAEQKVHDYYSDGSRAIVARLFADDFSAFGYPLDPE